MALRDQPYLPLYVQDYLTDEKLSMCSWETQGIYIKILCLLHKTEPYGTILLKQNEKQNKNIALDFACKITKLLPINIEVLYGAISQLIEEGCLTIENDKLFQKRMVRDNDISIKRELAGRKGGLKTQNFAKAKVEANTEYENEYENDNDNNILNSLKAQFEIFRLAYPGTKRGFKTEFDNFCKKHKEWEDIIPVLSDKLQSQILAREEKKFNGGFVPEWKNLSTWINQKCWEEEIITNNISNERNKRNNEPTSEQVARATLKGLGIQQQ